MSPPPSISGDEPQEHHSSVVTSSSEQISADQRNEMISSTPLQRSVNWIKAHHTSLNLLSSLISSSSYLLPSRFSSSDSTVEFTCAISDLISLLNQLCKHESSCMGSNGMTINGDGGNSSGDGGNGSTITR